VVGLQPESGPASLDSDRLQGRDADEIPCPVCEFGQLGPWHEDLTTGRSVALRVDPRQKFRMRLPRRLPNNRPIGGDVGNLDAEHEPHGVKELDKRSGGAGLDLNPRRLSVVDEQQVMLNVALRAQHQRLRAYTGREFVESLRGQIVQPRQSVGAAHPNHVAMRQVDHPGDGGQMSLLADRIAIMRGDTGVRRVSGNGSRPIEQRASIFAHVAPRQAAHLPNTAK